MPNPTPGWQHPDGRTIKALQYWYAGGWSIVVWLDEHGDSASGNVRHSDPGKRLVTLKPGERFYVLGELQTLDKVVVHLQHGQASGVIGRAGLPSTP